MSGKPYYWIEGRSFRMRGGEAVFTITKRTRTRIWFYTPEYDGENRRARSFTIPAFYRQAMRGRLVRSR